MVKEYHRYTCEICDRDYSDKGEASSCEARGLDKHTLPSGMVWVYNLHAPDVLVLLTKPVHDGHYASWECFWFRDNGAGDSLKSECGTQKEESIRYHMKEPINREMPALKRCKEYCEKNGIKIIFPEEVKP